VGVSRDCPIFWVPPIISGMGKATYFKFWRNIHRVDRNKSPWKMLGIVAVGVVRESWTFSGHHIGRIARSSLRQHSFLVLALCVVLTAGCYLVLTWTVFPVMSDKSCSFSFLVSACHKQGVFMGWVPKLKTRAVVSSYWFSKCNCKVMS